MISQGYYKGKFKKRGAIMNTSVYDFGVRIICYKNRWICMSSNDSDTLVSDYFAISFYS
jgi:hypothetical protein